MQPREQRRSLRRRGRRAYSWKVMSEADRVFPRRKDLGAQSSHSEQRLVLSARRRSGAVGGRSRVVEVVHVRRSGPRPVEDRPRPAPWSVRAEVWPEGFRAKPALVPAAARSPAGRTRTGAADRACHADVGADAAAIGTIGGATRRAAGRDGGSRRSDAPGAEAEGTEDDRAAFRGSLLPRRRRRELHPLRLPRRARAGEARPDDVLGVRLTYWPRDVGAPGDGPNASATTSRVDWPAGRAPLRARMPPRIG